MNKRQTLTEIADIVGIILIMLGLSLPILTGLGCGDYYQYIYTAGAVITLCGKIFRPPYKGSDLRLRRLTRMPFWGAVCYCVGAFFLFYPQGTLADWIAFTMAGAAIQTIATFMIIFRQKKLK